MNLDPDKTYVACAVIDGRRYWGGPLRGDRCSSANIKRTTVEEVGLFLAGLAHPNLSRAESIEVYELPSPTLTVQGPFTR